VFVAHAWATPFTLSESQIEQLANQPRTGVNNAVNDPAGGVDINFTVPMTEMDVIGFSLQFSPFADLSGSSATQSAFSSFDLNVTLLKGSTAVEILISDGNGREFHGPIQQLQPNVATDVTSPASNAPTGFNFADVTSFDFIVLGQGSPTNVNTTIEVAPLPEPASAAAIAIGIIGLTKRRR
jgi:hypothetical protein